MALSFEHPWDDPDRDIKRVVEKNRDFAPYPNLILPEWWPELPTEESEEDQC